MQGSACRSRHFRTVLGYIMTQKQIAEKLVVLHRNNLRAWARLKALESIIFHRMPPSEVQIAEKMIDEQANRLFQHLLEQAEASSPASAALLDNRGPKELEGLENPLE